MKYDILLRAFTEKREHDYTKIEMVKDTMLMVIVTIIFLGVGIAFVEGKMMAYAILCKIYCPIMFVVVMLTTAGQMSLRKWILTALWVSTIIIVTFIGTIFIICG